MKTNKKTITKITITKILILLFLLPLAFTTLSGAAGAQTQRDQQKQSAEELYKKAKQLIFSKDWKSAAEKLSHLVDGMPGNSFTDDSLYWLAFSMNRLSRKFDSLDRVLETQKNALRRLEALISRYPSSTFQDDARALKVEIAEDLVKKGFKEFKKYIENGAASDDNQEIKLLAIESLMNMDPDKTFPILEKIIRSGQSVKLRERAIFILSQTPDPRVKKILIDLALNDKDIRIREKAIFWLGQMNDPTITGQLKDIYTGLKGDDETTVKIKEKLIFSISQAEPDKGVKVLISLYKKEKTLKLKKKILFWLGQSKNDEAAAFIQKILMEKP